MGKGKTTGSGSVNGSINNNGGNIGASGNITYQNGSTTVKVQGNIDKHIPSHGKGQVNGVGQISITHQF